MDAFAYSVAARAEKVAEAAAPPRQSWFARFMLALRQSRRQQARREIERYAHLLPYSLDDRADRLVKRGCADMPFGSWWTPPT